METLAGDTTIGHATAWCQSVEALSGTRAPARAVALRGVALELERLANHTAISGARRRRRIPADRVVLRAAAR